MERRLRVLPDMGLHEPRERRDHRQGIARGLVRARLVARIPRETPRDGEIPRGRNHLDGHVKDARKTETREEETVHDILCQDPEVNRREVRRTDRRRSEHTHRGFEQDRIMGRMVSRFQTGRRSRRDPFEDGSLRRRDPRKDQHGRTRDNRNESAPPRGKNRTRSMCARNMGDERSAQHTRPRTPRKNRGHDRPRRRRPTDNGIQRLLIAVRIRELNPEKLNRDGIAPAKMLHPRDVNRDPDRERILPTIAHGDARPNAVLVHER